MPPALRLTGACDSYDHINWLVWAALPVQPEELVKMVWGGDEFVLVFLWFMWMCLDFFFFF